ncbi:reverse transcriptase domain-containing protein [Tanacetum coccineum]|uniref:Reverse transcriptase domain-containing protein n=1 Tax=Tanacetum coccineum TaxID=301880 RepID=A0ABQ5IAY4_9ASTR
MRTRNFNYPNNSPVTISRRRNRRCAPNVVEPELRTIFEVAPMADNRTMEELLQAPTEGYGEAIVIPEILAENFKIKTNLLQLVQANKFHGSERDNPHTHIANFKRMTATLKYRDVPNDVIKLMLFPYSLEGAARICEAWERFKEMLRACPHHGFTELTQIDTFYNGLNENDQDSLNAAEGGNLLSKTTREALNIIEKKSKVCYSRSKSNVSRVNTTSSYGYKVRRSCVICGGAHAYYNCIATDSNQSSVFAATEEILENLNNDMRSILGSFFQNQALTLGTLPSNTIPNPKGEMKAITTRSGIAYEGPSIPTNPSLKKVVERETEETTDKEQTNFQGSTAHIQPPAIPIPILERNVPKTLPRALIFQTI